MTTARNAGVYGLIEADHPPPHFHAYYGEHDAQIVIATGDVMGGSLPRRGLRLVKEWTDLHREELMNNWQKARNDLPLDRIEPLP